MAAPANNSESLIPQSGGAIATVGSARHLDASQDKSQSISPAFPAYSNVQPHDGIVVASGDHQVTVGAHHVIVKPGAATADQAREIVRDLASETLRGGIDLPSIQFASAELGGGNATDMVGFADLHVPLLFKIDRNDSLLKEARLIRRVRAREELPKRYREAWPIIYAIRDKPPYAYVSQYFSPADGWLSLEERLFSRNNIWTPPNEAVRQMHAVLDTLFEGYEATVNNRLPPSVRQDYLGRIAGRLTIAENLSPVFRSRELSVNGVLCAPWKNTLNRLKAHGIGLEALAPPFSTIVHGDPNPGNLFIRTNDSLVEVKLIDPKPLGRGDYLFDVAKIVHYLEATGPIEQSLSWTYPPQGERDSLFNTNKLEYGFIRHPATKALVTACLDRVEQFAAVHGDDYWRERFDLAMAANILGLPANRFAHPTKPQPEASIALYAEGLLWLERFCRYPVPQAA